MKEQASNTSMDKQLDILKQVEKVETPDHLYERILGRIKSPKNNLISLRWVSTAAAVFVLFVALDFYVVYQLHQQQIQEEVSEIMSIQNNHLYNE